MDKENMGTVTPQASLPQGITTREMAPDSDAMGPNEMDFAGAQRGTGPGVQHSATIDCDRAMEINNGKFQDEGMPK